MRQIKILNRSNSHRFRRCLILAPQFLCPLYCLTQHFFQFHRLTLSGTEFLSVRRQIQSMFSMYQNSSITNILQFFRYRKHLYEMQGLFRSHFINYYLRIPSSHPKPDRRQVPGCVSRYPIAFQKHERRLLSFYLNYQRPFTLINNPFLSSLSHHFLHLPLVKALSVRVVNFHSQKLINPLKFSHRHVHTLLPHFPSPFIPFL